MLQKNSDIHLDNNNNNKKGKGMSITYTEKVQLILASLVSLVTLLGSVWYAAIAVNNVHHDLIDVRREVTSVHAQVSHNNELLVEREEVDKFLLSNQKRMLEDMLTVVYINTNHVLVRTPDGKNIKIPMLHIIDELKGED